MFISPAGTSPLALSARQFAFVRAWAEGLDVFEAGLRYLGQDEAAEPRQARRELRRLLEQLRMLARSHGLPELAALLGRDPEAIADPDTAAPTLDEFRLLQPADFYSEAELLELYQAEYGRVDARSAKRRKQRLRERMVRALATLEGLGAQRLPLPGDGLAHWLEPAVCTRLHAAGLHRLGELTALIAAQGHRWYRQVPRLGPQGAAKLIGWLQAHQATLGALPADAVSAPRRVQREPLALADMAADAGGARPEVPGAILPLELLCQLAETPGLDQAAALREDCARVLQWLALRPAGSHTWRAYRREAERLLLWARLQQRSSLAGLTADDCRQYLVFLASPGPHWTSPRSTPRWSSAWRPFEAGLSPRSVATAAHILRAMFGWMQAQGLVAGNPWAEALLGRSGAGTAATTTVAAVAAQDAPGSALTAGEARPLRALPPALWQVLRAWVARQAPSPARARLALVLTLAHELGLRSAELVALRYGNLQLQASADGSSGSGGSLGPDPQDRAAPAAPAAERWCLAVGGRGGQVRELPLPAAAREALLHNLRVRQLADRLGAAPAAAPVVAQLGREQPLSAMRLYEVVKHALLHCARDLDKRDAASAQALRRASTHWLRHSYGVSEARRGVTLRQLQEQMGHLSPASTRAYLLPDAG